MRRTRKTRSNSRARGRREGKEAREWNTRCKSGRGRTKE